MLTQIRIVNYDTDRYYITVKGNRRNLTLFSIAMLNSSGMVIASNGHEFEIQDNNLDFRKDTKIVEYTFYNYYRTKNFKVYETFAKDLQNCGMLGNSNLEYRKP